MTLIYLGWEDVDAISPSIVTLKTSSTLRPISPPRFSQQAEKSRDGEVKDGRERASFCFRSVCVFRERKRSGFTEMVKSR